MQLRQLESRVWFVMKMCISAGREDQVNIITSVRGNASVTPKGQRLAWRGYPVPSSDGVVTIPKTSAKATNSCYPQ